MNDKLIPRTLLILLLACAFPAASFAFFSVGVSVGFAPPALPLYAQPPCPAAGYLWTPGYWAYSADIADYYWVPGTWVVGPEPGLLWTPGYWGTEGGGYLWNAGYWGPQIGFYGGINYGYGYFGSGFEGGYWRDNDFYYNRAVTNISNVNVTNVYNRTVLNTNYYGNRPSFNGGIGVHARPTASDLLAAREPHRGVTQPQRMQAASAQNIPGLRASVNHGYPTVAATARPGAFQSRDVVPAHYASLASAPRVNEPAWNSSGAAAQFRASAQQAGPTRSQWRQPSPAPAARQAPGARSAPAVSYRPSQAFAPAPRAASSVVRYSSYSPPTRQTFSQAPRAAFSGAQHGGYSPPTGQPFSQPARNSSASHYSPPSPQARPATTQQRR